MLAGRRIRLDDDVSYARLPTRWTRFKAWAAERTKATMTIDLKWTEEVLASHDEMTRQFVNGGYCETLTTTHWVKCNNTPKGE